MFESVRTESIPSDGMLRLPVADEASVDVVLDIC